MAPNVARRMNQDHHYDLLVIGSGPAGEKGAAQAAYFGKRVALVERDAFLGGAAANTGTLPSKTLRETAVFLSGFRQRELFGLDVGIKKKVSVRDFMAKGKFLLHEHPAGTLIACVYLETTPDSRCYLGLLSVLPEHQGKGLAPQILSVAEDFACHANCHTIWLRTLSARVPPLRPFYERFGYTLLEMTPLPPLLHPQIPCEFVVMQKRLT